jgi:hypothetical protein
MEVPPVFMCVVESSVCKQLNRLLYAVERMLRLS